MISDIDTQETDSVSCSLYQIQEKERNNTMMHVTQKELRNMGHQLFCEDITYSKQSDYDRIMKEEDGWLDTIAYSTGDGLRLL